MNGLTDHPLRYAMANELHARPFPTLKAPCSAAYLAIKQPQDAAGRDRDADRAHLIDLLDRHGADHPSPGATHYYGQIGKVWLKWESHTEFVTYSAFTQNVGERAFDPAEFEVFPADWLAKAPGPRLTSALIRIEQQNNGRSPGEKVDEWFVSESLAVSDVLDRSATVAGDFRIDPAGHLRFALFVTPQTGARRTGRIVQRICEIETYKSMSMLGLARVRSMNPRLAEIDQQLLTLVDQMTSGHGAADKTLEALLGISAELENMTAKSAFRFGATKAYEAIVNQRINVLREERYDGRQTFAEFMMRRFDPAMRTVAATERRLVQMSDRAIRAGDLLRTRVDVERQAQNQELLASMDKRADLQLRLQRTVEGLSVVAISYYAVNLVVYMAGPLGDLAGLTKLVFTALVTPLVILGVWYLVRRIHRTME